MIIWILLVLAIEQNSFLCELLFCANIFIEQKILEINIIPPCKRKNVKMKIWIYKYKTMIFIQNILIRWIYPSLSLLLKPVGKYYFSRLSFSCFFWGLVIKSRPSFMLGQASFQWAVFLTSFFSFYVVCFKTIIQAGL